MMQGSVGNILKYSAEDISALPSSLGTLCTNGARKICITVCGTGSGTVKFKLALGSSVSLPMEDGEIISNKEVVMSKSLNNGAIVEVVDIDGYSEVAIVSVVTSGTIDGSVFIEAIS